MNYFVLIRFNLIVNYAYICYMLAAVIMINHYTTLCTVYILKRSVLTKLIL